MDFSLFKAVFNISTVKFLSPLVNNLLNGTATDISVDYNNGDIPYYEDSKNGIPNDEMGEPNRVKQAFNFVLEGIYTNYKEGDKKLNALFKFGEFIGINKIKEGAFYNTFFNDTLKGYFLDELNYNIKHNIKDNQRPLINTIFGSKFNNKTNQEVLDYILNTNNNDIIVKEISNYFDNTLIKNKVEDYLINNNILFKNNIEKGKPVTYTILLNNNRITNLFGKSQTQNTLNETNKNNLLRYIVLNQFVARQEILKLFIGNPSQFKNFEDFIKRVSSTAASKVYPDVSDKHIEALNSLGDNFVYTSNLKVKVNPEITTSTFDNEEDVNNIRKILELKYDKFKI